MFIKFNFYLKVLILLFLYSGVFFIGSQLYLMAISSKSLLEVIGINFIICWDLILVGFFFFQAFKYFRLPQFFYRKRKMETELWFKLLGVPFFRWVLVNSFFRHLNNKAVEFFSHSRTRV